jgi:glycosyltransferase involved in cell wall biosynthesis
VNWPGATFHGVPVTGSRRGGIPELIDGGEIGYLFHPDQPEELVECLMRLIDDRYLIKRMSETALAKAPFFGADRMVDDYLNLYSRLLDCSVSGAADHERRVRGSVLGA